MMAGILTPTPRSGGSVADMMTSYPDDYADPRQHILRNEGTNMSGAGLFMPQTAIPNLFRGSMGPTIEESERPARGPRRKRPGTKA